MKSISKSFKFVPLMGSVSLFALMSIVPFEGVAHASYAAIATGDANNVWGDSWNYRTQQEAEAAALQACGRKGGASCQVRIWSRNECIAVARDPGSLTLFFGGDTNLAQAQAIAINNCGNGACAVEVSDCTTPDEPRPRPWRRW